MSAKAKEKDPPVAQTAMILTLGRLVRYGARKIAKSWVTTSPGKGAGKEGKAATTEAQEKPGQFCFRLFPW